MYIGTLFLNRNHFENLIHYCKIDFARTDENPISKVGIESHQAMRLSNSKAQSNYIKCLEMDDLFGTWIMYCGIQAPWRIYDNDDTRHFIMSINLKEWKGKEKNLHLENRKYSGAKHLYCLLFIIGFEASTCILSFQNIGIFFSPNIDLFDWIHTNTLFIDKIEYFVETIVTKNNFMS